MTTATVNVRTLKQKIKWVVDAEVADSWKGGRDPADIPYIEANLKAARASLDDYIVRCVKEPS